MHEHATLAALQELGLTQSEAKIYLALLANSSANGNQVSRHAGVPSAKVYENLERLRAQGLVAQLDDGKYVALDLEEFLGQKRSRMREVETLLRESVRRKTHAVHGEILWHGRGYRALIDRAERLIATAHEEVLISGWPAELQQLLATLDAALERGVRVAVLAFTPQHEVAPLFADLLHHPTLSAFGHAMFPSVQDRHRDQAAFVADGAATLLMSGSTGAEWVGVRTTNPAVVETVANYIRHDIYINKIYAAFGPQLQAAYGPQLALLLDPHRAGEDHDPGPDEEARP